MQSMNNEAHNQAVVAYFPGNRTIHAVEGGKVACGHTSRRYRPVIVSVTPEEEAAWDTKCAKCYGN